mmetsp:Transcript_99955/g.260590  ORF Transcript_99955/g.260590 Transcript_99955/m.260590 type:complete len:522 (+) Transcript_99955:311-1876(+)
MSVWADYARACLDLNVPHLLRGRLRDDDSAHLPGGHVAIVVVRVVVPLDAEQLVVEAKEQRLRQAVLVAPQARRQMHVPFLVIQLVAGPVLRIHVAEELPGIRVVQLHREATRGVAVRPRVNELDASRLRRVRAGEAGASTALGCAAGLAHLPDRPARSDGVNALRGRRARVTLDDIILSSGDLCLPVEPLQIQMGARGVLLEVEPELQIIRHDVILPGVLILIQEDVAAVAAHDAADVRVRLAGGIVDETEIRGRLRGATRRRERLPLRPVDTVRARALQEAAVLLIGWSGAAVRCLWEGPQRPHCRVVAVLRVDGHVRHGKVRRRVQELGVALWVAVPALAHLPAVTLAEHLGERHTIRRSLIAARRDARRPLREPGPVELPRVPRRVRGALRHLLDAGVRAVQEGHVVVIVDVEDWDRRVRCARGVAPVHVVHFVPDDGHGLVGEPRDDLRVKGHLRHHPASDLAVACADRRRVDVEELAGILCRVRPQEIGDRVRHGVHVRGGCKDRRGSETPPHRH